ncbi:MAG: hypothetical protein QOE65_2447 [Solirubrobacteraceae bacterium]|nr:hypothetical protein [Solirubrobacteraceae bacterium]
MANKPLVLVACILGSGIAFLDGTIVNVALPAIASDLDAGLSIQQWVVGGYLLTLGSFLLVGGALGDLLGRRRVFVGGAAAFGAASLLCALAPSPVWLVVFRLLQGVAAAVLVPSTMGIIVTVFDEDERGRAIGTWTAWTGISTVIGPLAGGLLVQAASWRWVFLVNLPFVVLTIVLTLRAMPDDRPPGRRAPLDVRGAALAALGLAGPVFALIEQPDRGWGDPIVWGPLVAGIVFLAAFVAEERRAHDPMVPFELFRRRNFTAGNLATLAMYAGLGLPFFYLVLFLQQAAGYGPIQAGLALLPVTLLMLALSRRFGALADRIGPRPLMTAGPLVGAVGLLLLVRVDAHPDYVRDLLPALVVFGIGLSATVAPLTAAVLSAVDPEHAGAASGVNNAVARVSGLLAVAATGVLVSMNFASAVDARVDARALSPPARAALARAKERPLSAQLPPTVRGRERVELRRALQTGSAQALHMSILLAAGLLALAGAISFVGVRDERRRSVPCEGCPGGALVGAPADPARELVGATTV